MQVIRSVRRAEITFWTAMIALMRSQRLVRLAIITSLFVLCLGVLGIADLTLNHKPARNAARSPQNLVVSVSQPQAAAAVPAREQRNILVILVDSLTDADPGLEGLWLVGKLPSSPHLVFFPIFPSPRGATAGQWSGAFGLDGDGLPSAAFVEDLHAKNIQWDNYLVVDHASLADLIELAGRIAWDGKSLNGQEVVAKMPLPQLEPQAALQTQAFVAQELCHSTAALIQSADPALIWGLLTHRMRSDLELTSVQAAQNDLALIVGGPTCEFPTFQEISSLTGAE
jgi:hypothetical protein